MNKVIFLDRDGIINELVYDAEQGTVDAPLKVEDVHFTPFIFLFLQHTKSLGYKHIVISNQPVVALGKTTIKNIENIKKYIADICSDNGVTLDAQYYCLHHPYAKIPEYKVDCDCRKPKITLFLQAAKEYDIDLSSSYMIGDGVNDIVAGKNAGCKTILITNTNETEYLRIIEQKLNGIKPDFLTKNMKEAISIISS